LHDSYHQVEYFYTFVKQISCFCCCSPHFYFCKVKMISRLCWTSN
jgi:hypothetical protein